MRIITFFLILILIMFHLVTNAQNWMWANNIDNNGTDIGNSVGADAMGNVYVTGTSPHIQMFWKFDSVGNLLWEKVPNMLVNRSVTDINGNTYMAGDKIAKYDSSGQELWLLSITISGYYDIAMHSSGGVVAYGKKIIGDSTKSVLARFDENGNCLWTKIGEYPGGYAVTCDNGGNSYLVGDGYLDSASGNSGFLVKFDINGNVVYNRIIPHTATDITIDDQNNIYVTGRSGDTININGNKYYAGQYLIKYDQSGNALWYKIMTGSIGTSAIETNKRGDIFLTISASIFYMDNYSIPSGGDLFVIKMDSVGNILWFEQSQRLSTYAGVYPNSMCVNTHEEIYITGAMSGSHSFGSIVLTRNSMYSDMLVLKMGQSAPTKIPSDKNKDLEWNVFPSPATGIIFINLLSENTPETYLLKITNSLGKTIYTQTLKDISGSFTKEIDLSSYSKGIYFVELQPLVNSKSHTREIRKIVLQ